MIEIINGQIFIDGIQTTSPELIGLAMLDFVETTKDNILSITLKDGDVFVDDFESVKVYLQ